jgi:hypothetical protein
LRSSTEKEDGKVLSTSRLPHRGIVRVDHNRCRPRLQTLERFASFTTSDALRRGALWRCRRRGVIAASYTANCSRLDLSKTGSRLNINWEENP